MTVLQNAFDLLCTTFAIPYLNGMPIKLYFVIYFPMMCNKYVFLTVYANKGVPIPIVEGVSFVDPEIKFGTVLHTLLL